MEIPGRVLSAEGHDCQTCQSLIRYGENPEDAVSPIQELVATIADQCIETDRQLVRIRDDEIPDGLDRHSLATMLGLYAEAGKAALRRKQLDAYALACMTCSDDACPLLTLQRMDVPALLTDSVETR